MRAYVLVVERDLQTREIIRDMLNICSHTAFCVATMSMALKVLGAIQFDAIVMSPGALALGEPSYGVEAKRKQPKIKVIMASASPMPEFLLPPIDAFVQKPFSIQSIDQALQTVLART